MNSRPSAPTIFTSSGRLNHSDLNWCSAELQVPAAVIFRLRDRSPARAPPPPTTHSTAPVQTAGLSRSLPASSRDQS